VLLVITRGENYGIVKNQQKKSQQTQKQLEQPEQQSTMLCTIASQLYSHKPVYYVEASRTVSMPPLSLTPFIIITIGYDVFPIAYREDSTSRFKTDVVINTHE